MTKVDLLNVWNPEMNGNPRPVNGKLLQKLSERVELLNQNHWVGVAAA